MKKILIFGAGRSSSALLNYLSNEKNRKDLSVSVFDKQPADYVTKLHKEGLINLIEGDIHDNDRRTGIVENSDLVISMLPARFHINIARDCLRFNKNLVTASYVSDEMRALNDEARRKGLLFLNECGLDPGIDHMSAMKVINRLRDEGYELTEFETFTGGLLMPNDHQDNPWHYKFTWNPRNVILAGQGITKFIQQGRLKYIPYHRVFRRTETIFIKGYGYFEGYGNRDSLKYLDIYGLGGIKTLYRGTLRRPGFCKTWDTFVQLGATDDSYEMDGVANMTHRDFINSFLSYNPSDSVELKLAHYMYFDLEGEEMNRLKWAGIFDDTPVGLSYGTPAQILEHILKKKWMLNSEERDMIVMWHKFTFLEGEEYKVINSTLVATGDHNSDTAMAKTVGLPVGIAARLILEGKISMKGVRVPIFPEIYNPILKELGGFGFDMKETTGETTGEPG